jgi:hypothetical protein
MFWPIMTPRSDMTVRATRIQTAPAIEESHLRNVFRKTAGITTAANSNQSVKESP